MDIEKYINQLKVSRNGKSFAFLAERCETSAEASYRIRPTMPIKADETLVLMLCGASRDGDDHIREYNGYLKQVDDFVKNSPKLKDKKVRVCVAVCNFGKYHDTDMARELHHLRFYNPTQYKEILNTMSPDAREEMINPAYIKDIFNAVYLPRVLHKDNISQNILETLCNIRRVTTVTHCHGGYVALELENILSLHAQKLGYSPHERNQLLSQQLVLNFCPDCAKHNSHSQFISFQSAADEHNCHTTYIEEYLLMKPKDFGLLRIPKKLGNILMCAQVDKSGIEGNPGKVYIARPIEEVMREIEEARINAIKNKTKEPEEEKYVSEHSFIGFTPKDNMSKGAIKMQQFACNILENGVYNSLQQSNDKFYPLPSFMQLAANSREERFDMSKAYLTWYKISLGMLTTSKNSIASYNAYRREHIIDL